MKEFVPVSDEALDTAPDLFNHLVPYHNDYCCRRSYCHSFEVTPADLQVQIPTNDSDRRAHHRQDDQSEV
jgi:hypothetical protein